MNAGVAAEAEDPRFFSSAPTAGQSAAGTPATGQADESGSVWAAATRGTARPSRYAILAPCARATECQPGRGRRSGVAIIGGGPGDPT